MISDRNSHIILIDRLRTFSIQLKYHNAVSELYYLAFKAGFHADQPRVPRGSPDGGQWTLVSGGRDGPWFPRKPIDLRVHEAMGGHTINRHVGKSVNYLVRRLTEPQNIRGKLLYVQIAGSFPSLEAAQKLVNSTLSSFRAPVEMVASGKADEAMIFKIFSSKTGYEVYTARTFWENVMLLPPSNIPKYRDTYGVKVFIRHDPTSPDGFRVDTAFPFSEVGYDE